MDFPMMRYAEILLDYAEAENEAEDTNTAREKAIAQLNRDTSSCRYHDRLTGRRL